MSPGGRLFCLTTLIWSGAIFSGCGTDSRVFPSFDVRDSAGVVIVQNRGRLAPGDGGWRLTEAPRLQIGAASGDEAYLMFRVWGATRLSDGRIAVANNGTPDIRIFSPGGEHLRSYGTRGEGPGEFDSPVLMGVLPGDTLVLVDRLLRRIYLFDPDEGFVRGVTADPSIPGYLLTAGMFSSGSVLVRRSAWNVEAPNGLYRFPMQYLSVSLGGDVETEFGEFPGDETVFATQEVADGSIVLSTSRPFGKTAVAAVRGERFFYSSQDTYEIQIRDQSGVLRRIIRRDQEPLPVTEEDIRALTDEMAGEDDDTEQAKQFRRMLRETPIPEHHPAHGAIHADRRGCLWVEEYRPPGDTDRVATIFDPEGRMIGALRLPLDLRIEEIGEDYVLGRYADPLGVEYLQLYGLMRPDSG